MFGPNNGYDPKQLASAYNLSQAQFAGGIGATVAVVDAYDDPNAEADLSAYRQQFGLGECSTANGCFKKVNQSGGTDFSKTPPNANWSMEISLDLDMVSAICPKCHILLVESNDAQCSWDAQNLNSLTCSLFEGVKTAINLGAKYVSNSYGAPEFGPVKDSNGHDINGVQDFVDQKYFNHPGTVITASTGDNGYAGKGNTLASYPATSKYITAVGGTSLAVDTGSSRGWTEAAWSGAGSGCSKYDSKPAWQTVVTGCTNRAEADVSAVADPNPGVAVYDTYSPDPATFQNGWGAIGGTSASSPIIASMYALADAAGGSDYPAAYPYKHPTAFNDVIGGSNGTCPGVLCNAGPGWDGPTGLGTPDGVKGLANPANHVAAANPGDQWTKIGTKVDLQMKATGGSGHYLWSALGLPQGLSIDPATGVISGTPTTVERMNVTVTVNDASISSDSVSFVWKVAEVDKLTIKAPASMTTQVGQAGSAQITAAGGLKPYTFSAAGLPPGLSINPATGLITGTAATAGTYNVTVMVKDSGGQPPAATTTSSTPSCKWQQEAIATFPWTVTSPAPSPTPTPGKPGMPITGQFSAGPSTPGSGLPFWTVIVTLAVGAIGGAAVYLSRRLQRS